MFLKEILNQGPIGSIIIDLKETESTNLEAHSLARQGVKEGTVIIAEKQTQGKGRQGKQWYSPEGGLYCSLILRPLIPPKDIGVIEKIAVLAVWQTIKTIADPQPQIKLPNDILLKGKKVSGVLLESRIGEREVGYVIIGIGINCVSPLSVFPDFLREFVTTLASEGRKTISVEVTFELLLNYLNYWYGLFWAGAQVWIEKHWDSLTRICQRRNGERMGRTCQNTS